MEEKKEKQIVNSQAEGTAPEGTTKAAAPKGSTKADASKEPAKAATPEEPAKAAAPEGSAKEAVPEESLKAALAKQAIEEEASGSASFTLRKILGGDILTAQIIRKQIWLFVLIVFFVIIYISNRYSIQKDLIELDQLQKELQDTKYKALSTSSQITEKSRESNVLDVLKHSKDSILHIATQPPYIINVPEE